MKNYFTKALLTVATLGLFSCSDQLAEEVVLSPQEGSTSGYVAFKINTVGNSTRATSGGTHAGDDQEYAICGNAGANVAFFFDSNDKFHSKSNLEEISSVTNGDGHDNNEKAYQARIVKEKDKIITNCLIILNGDPQKISKLPLTSGTSLESFMESIDNEESLGQYTYDNENYFTMSNSVYVSGDNKIECAVNVKDKIYPTLAEAEDNKVTVHVERLVAKFELDFKKNTISDNIIIEGKKVTLRTKAAPENGQSVDDIVKSVEWTANIIGWNVSNTETETFWFKNLENTNTPTDFKTYWLYGKWAKDTNTEDKQIGWNNSTLLRSYWAVDPHYDSADDFYPTQYRYYDGGKTKKDKNGEETETILKYLTYNEIGTQKIGYKYAPENTFAYSWFNDDEEYDETCGFDYKGEKYKLTDTYILIAAELKLGTENAKTTYYYNSFYWYDETELLKYMLQQILEDYPLYTSQTIEENNKFNPITADVENYFKLDKANIKGGDGRVVVLYKGNENGKLYYVDNGQVKEFTAEEEGYLELMEEFGSAKCYKDGKMYYAIPIEHLAAKGSTETPHLYNVGAYGVVRNHWYQVTVNKITKPGTPVQDPDQPIVPNDDPDEEGYAAFEIVVIPWHKVNWSVDL